VKNKTYYFEIRYHNEYDGKRTDYRKNTRSIKIIEKKTYLNCL